MPLLLESMGELAKTKPENPIEYIAKYLLKHNPEKVQSKQAEWYEKSQDFYMCKF